MPQRPGSDSPAAAAASSAKGAPGPTPSTKAGRGFVFFSDRLRAATGDALTIEFTPAVLAAIGPELEKVRAARQLAMSERSQQSCPRAIRAHIESEAFRRLRAEATHRFDTVRYPLAQALREMLRLDAPLHRLHEAYHADRGGKGDRQEKARLLAPLTQPQSRAPLTQACESPSPCPNLNLNLTINPNTNREPCPNSFPSPNPSPP